VLCQAGFAAVGLNGVWCAQETLLDGKLVARSELVELGLRGRKLYIAFDADIVSKPEVRSASIRLFFLLGVAGAEVYQLTSWGLEQGKGIDDYLVNERRDDPTRTPTQIVEMLLSDAQPFIGSFSKSKIDLDAVEDGLTKVRIPTLYRHQLCKQLHEPLGVKVDLLRAIGTQEESQKAAIGFDQEIEPWADPVDGAELLHEISAILRRHVVMGNESLLAVTLWIIMTYLCDVAEFLPLLCLLSPTKRCGKTRTLGVLVRLVHRPLPSVLIGAPAMFRSIQKWHPTLLIDEADQFLKDNMELRAVINSGHSRDSAWVPRCEGDNHEVAMFSTWAPKVIAQIGRPHDTNEDRAIVINLQRRTKSEIIQPIRETPKEEFENIKRKIVRWVNDNSQDVALAKPEIPKALNDRAADNWSTLLSIAQVIGGEWSDLALKAISILSPSDDDDDSIMTTLLIAMRALFKKNNYTQDDDLYPTTQLVDALNLDKEAPWSDWRDGKGLTPTKLRSLLKRFPDVKPDRIRSTVDSPRGYKYGPLRIIFDRYLAPQKTQKTG